MKKRNLIYLLTALLSLTILTGCENSQEPESSSSLPDISISESETEPVDVDRLEAEKVIAMIDALDSDSSEEEILAVYEAYNNLTPRQKGFVTNYEKLEGFIAEIQILQLVEQVREMIDSLDEEDPDEEAVQAAREAYNYIGEQYGASYQTKVGADKVAKLERCEAKICNKIIGPLITLVNSLNPSVSKEASQIRLLVERIEDFLEPLSETTISNIPNYQEYSTKRDLVKKRYYIAAGDYITTTHNTGEKLFTNIERINNDTYGYVYEEDLTSLNLHGNGNVQVGARADFSMYQTIAFFACYPFGDLNIQFINDERTVAASEPNTANEYVYMEIPTKNLGDVHGAEYSHIGAFFSDLSIACRDGYYFSAIIGIAIDEEEAQAAVDHVEELIAALDEEHPDAEAIQAARAAYNALKEDYSLEWQQKVGEEYLEKLQRLENLLSTILINDYILKANSLDLSNDMVKGQFALLMNRIDDIYNSLTDTQKELVNNYDAYLEKRQVVNRNIGILYDRDIVYWSGTSDVTALRKDDENYGLIYDLNLSSPRQPSNPGSIALNFANQGEDWSSHVKMAFYAQYDVSNTENEWFIVNGNWDTLLNPKRTLVDETKNIYFYEFDLSSVTEPFTNNCYIQMYFSEVTSQVTFSEFIYYDNDVLELNNLISKANAITLSNNQEITRFVLFSEKIDKIYSELKASDRNRVEGYDAYLTKKSSANASILFNGNITTSNNGDWPSLEPHDDENYCSLRTFDYGANKTGTVNAFFECRNTSWANHKKMSFFCKIDNPTTDRVWLILEEGWATTIAVDPILVSGTTSTYYCEFNLQTVDSSKLSNLGINPEVWIYLSEGCTTKTISITSVVALDA